MSLEFSVLCNLSRGPLVVAICSRSPVRPLLRSLGKGPMVGFSCISPILWRPLDVVICIVSPVVGPVGWVSRNDSHGLFTRGRILLVSHAGSHRVHPWVCFMGIFFLGVTLVVKLVGVLGFPWSSPALHWYVPNVGP